MPIPLELKNSNESIAMDPRVADHERFLSLVDSQRRALFKVAWAYTRTSHDRDDLLQEIVGQLWASFPKYDSSRPFATWMYRVALNVAIDFQRRQRRRWKETAGLDEAAASLTTLSADEAARAQQLRDLHELLEQQDDADRAILILHLEGHSHRDIGAVIGISESNVGTRLNRLKKSMRQTIHGAASDKEGEV
jgi:RNA polymerase sigma-70 factor (ECF subfamily)